MNILCGPNGIGKTTILETIAHAFSNGETNLLKRNVNSELSTINISVENNGEIKNQQIQFDTFGPEKATKFHGLYDLSSGLISLKAERSFAYKALHAVNKDSKKEVNDEHCNL